MAQDPQQRASEGGPAREVGLGPVSRDGNGRKPAEDEARDARWHPPDRPETLPAEHEPLGHPDRESNNGGAGRTGGVQDVG